MVAPSRLARTTLRISCLLGALMRCSLGRPSAARVARPPVPVSSTHLVCPGQRLVGMDLVEVLPDTDSAGITSFAAAGIMHAFLACLAANKKHNPS